MPTALPLDQVPNTLADWHLAIAARRKQTQPKPDWDRISRNGQDYVVFEDQSCIPIHKNKLGHIACIDNETDTVPWYPLGTLDIQPQWISSLNPSPNGEGMVILEKIRTKLLLLLDGMGTRITLKIASAPITRNGALQAPVITLTGLALPLENVFQDAIKNKITLPRMSNSLNNTWKPNQPIVSGLTLCESSFSGRTKNISVHKALQQLDTFIND